MTAKGEDDVEYLAPENFTMVEPGVYRSAFPRTKNLQFLKQLNLKSVVSLVPEDYPAAMLEYYSTNGIRLISVGLDGNKWPFKEINAQGMQTVLQHILNEKNRPLLIHCNKGKHRTGSVVGCLRRIRGWALSSVFTEYLLFAAPKTRLEDQQMIEYFQFDCNAPALPDEEQNTETCLEYDVSNSNSSAQQITRSDVEESTDKESILVQNSELPSNSSSENYNKRTNDGVSAGIFKEKASLAVVEQSQ